MSSRFSPWHASVPLPEQQMQEIVASLDKIGSVDDVVRVVMQIETSEINPIFLGVVEATESPFVKTLSPFRTAIRHHVDYICRSVTAFTASGAAASRELRASLPDRVRRGGLWQSPLVWSNYYASFRLLKTLECPTYIEKVRGQFGSWWPLPRHRERRSSQVSARRGPLVLPRRAFSWHFHRTRRQSYFVLPSLSSSSRRLLGKSPRSARPRGRPSS